jgi:copper chaperone CopZ
MNGQNSCCQVNPVEKPVDREALTNAKAAYLAVRGMGCQSCAMRVKNSLMSINGVLLTDVDVNGGMAAVAYEPKKVRIDDLLDAVVAAGGDGRHNYQAKLVRESSAQEALGI